MGSRLVSHLLSVMLDGAACRRANQPVMTGNMPGDTADRSALEAPLGTGDRGNHSDRRTEYPYDEKFAHRDPCQRAPDDAKEC